MPEFLRLLGMYDWQHRFHSVSVYYERSDTLRLLKKLLIEVENRTWKPRYSMSVSFSLQEVAPGDKLKSSTSWSEISLVLY